MDQLKYNTINFSIDNEILTITLNRPEKRNSLNQELVTEFKDVLQRFKKDDTIFAVIITGSGKAFCAGADLAYLKTLLDFNYEKNLNDSLALKDLYFMLYSYPKPTVAMVNGPAVAGGCGLVNVCDFVFSAENAKFGYPEVKIGFVASMVSIFLVQSIGERAAKNLLLSGKLIDAKHAKNIGFVDEIKPENELRDFSVHFLKSLKENSPQSLEYSKNLFSEIIFDDLDKKLIKACEFNAKSRGTGDFKEGITSFLEKRKPNW